MVVVGGTVVVFGGAVVVVGGTVVVVVGGLVVVVVAFGGTDFVGELEHPARRTASAVVATKTALLVR